MVVDYNEKWAPGQDGFDRHIGTIRVPMRTVSEANTRGHWATKARRAKDQRTTCRLVCGAPLAKYRLGLRDGYVPRLHIRITRIAPGELDDDNLPVALKSVRDGITDALGLTNDRDLRLVWVYSQARKARTYAVEITAWSGK